MRIFYRGYVINESAIGVGCTVEGRRPDRGEVAIEETARTAMRWIDQDILRRKVAETDWLSARLLSA